MFKEIFLKQSDGTERAIPFAANAATPIRLKQVFNRDFWKIFGSKDEVDRAGITENLDVISEMAYIMHAQGAHADMATINFETYVNWLESLDGMAILDNAGEILDLYISSDRRGSKAKNQDAQPPAA